MQGVLQCVAVCCSVLQNAAVCCCVWQCIAECFSVLQCVVVRCSALQCVVVLPILVRKVTFLFYFVSIVYTRPQGLVALVIEDFFCALQCVVVCCSVLQRFWLQL